MNDRSRRDTTKVPISNLSRLDGWLAAAVAGVSLLIHWLTLAPGLLPGDSGEFQVLAHLLGNTHPTGYAVYLLLAKLFTFLPLGEIAYRVNLFSAAMAAATVAGVYLLARTISGYRAVAVAASLALAISPTFWSQAIIAEVYTAGAAFFILVLLALVWWQQSGKPRDLFLAGLAGGLSIGVHLSVALLAPVAVLSLWLVSRRHRSDGPPGQMIWRSALLGGLAGLAIAVLCFHLLYWRNTPADFFNSAVIPARSNWDVAAESIDGPWDQLWFHWSARQFRRFMFANPAEFMISQATDYGQQLPAEVAPFLLVLALIGLLSLLCRSRQQALLLAGALFLQWLYTFNYDIWDLYVFHIPSYLLLLVLAAAGAGAVIELLNWLTRRWTVKHGLFDLVLALAMVALGLWPVLQPNVMAIGQRRVPFRSRLYPVDEFSLRQLHPVVREVVQDLPANAILFTDWDMLYPYYYAAHIESDRLDLMFVETYPSSDRRGLADSAVTFIGEQLDAHPVYLSDWAPEITRAGYRLSPTHVGPLQLYRVRSNSE